jgi:hypothetical protein
VSVKRPSASVLVCPSCAGPPEPAAHNVTVESAIGAPAPSTLPVIVSASAGAHATKPKAAKAPREKSAVRPIDTMVRMTKPFDASANLKGGHQKISVKCAFNSQRPP